MAEWCMVNRLGSKKETGKMELKISTQPIAEKKSSYCKRQAGEANWIGWTQSELLSDASRPAIRLSL